MDIVEQCRKAKEYNLFDADVYEQAANEIERLRADNKKFEMIISKLLCKMATDDIVKNLLDHGVFISDTK